MPHIAHAYVQLDGGLMCTLLSYNIGSDMYATILQYRDSLFEKSTLGRAVSPFFE